MKNTNQLFGTKFKEIRLNRGITRTTLSEGINVDDSEISRWERGYSLPNKDILLEATKFLDLNIDDTKQLFILANIDVESFFNSEDKPTFEPTILNPVIEINAQIKDIKNAFEKLNTKISVDNTTNSGVYNEIEDIKTSIIELQAKSELLKVPIKLPTQKEMEVKLVNSSSLQRLEEYRSEESKWLTWFGTFFGSIIGIFSNLVTGGTFSNQTWIVLGVFFCMAGLTAYTAIENRNKAKELVKKLLEG